MYCKMIYFLNLKRVSRKKFKNYTQIIREYKDKQKQGKALLKKHFYCID